MWSKCAQFIKRERPKKTFKILTTKTTQMIRKLKQKTVTAMMMIKILKIRLSSSKIAEAHPHLERRVV
ncbi:hypothetical protein ACLKA6_013619 [Drosophila palustris]